MIKIKKPSNNLVIGIIIGYLLLSLINLEANSIIYVLNKNNLQEYTTLIRILSIVLEIIVFIFVVYRFNRLKSDKLNFYFISSIILSIFITTQVFFLFVIIFRVISSNIDSPLYVTFLRSDVGSLIMANFIGFNLILLAGLFFITFTLLINRKVKYIKYIIKEIKIIESEGFGRTIEVKGNDELSELSLSINRMSTKLKENIEKEKIIENNKNELITNVSHDLRTPLTSINGYIDLIKENGFKDIDKFNEYINVVDKRAKGLNCLINELFDYTKLNNKDIKLNYSTVDIVNLVQHISNEYSCIFEKNGLTLNSYIPDNEIFMDLDVEKIVRVFQNILSNGNKYSIKNSSVILLLTEDKHEVTISISNKTNEIDENNISNIFNRFYKGDKSRSENESSGLGLSIAKKIVELHGGTITAFLRGDVVTFKISLYKEIN